MISRVTTVFDYPHAYPITASSFEVPGLGEAGLKCGVNRMSDFAEDGSALRYSPLRCKRIECPECWMDWARKTVFSIVMRIETYARLHNERPNVMLMSVPPWRAKEWSWERVNESLFRRGYRRAKNNAGVTGGISIFHPFRIRKLWQMRFKRGGVHSSGGYWKEIRRRCQEGEPLERFALYSPHVHSIVFGEPTAHQCDDYLIRFKDDHHHFPQNLERIAGVVGLVTYLVTHTGVLTQLREYENGVQRRKTQTIREFGSLFRIQPHEELSVDEFNELAEEIAKSIILRVEKDKNGNPKKIVMDWNSKRAREMIEADEPFPDIVDECLRYPASPQGLEGSEVDPEWVPIQELDNYLSNEEWLSSLKPSQRKFWLKVLKFMRIEGRAPEPEDGLDPPPTISTWVVGEGRNDDFVSSVECSKGYSQVEIPDFPSRGIKGGDIDVE